MFYPLLNIAGVSKKQNYEKSDHFEVKHLYTHWRLQEKGKAWKKNYMKVMDQYFWSNFNTTLPST